MRIRNTPLTDGLRAWLRQAGDNATALLVGADHGDILVTRADGRDLSESEEIEVRALLAAHAVEPLKPPRKR